MTVPTNTVTAPTLHRPDTLAEACQLLAELDQPMVYGGGTAVGILLKQGVLFASDLVDIIRVPGLDEVAETDAGLRIGGMVTLRRMETDPLVRRIAPLAARVYGAVANPRVRNTASVGGNLAHGDYRLDPPTALLALEARIEIASATGTRMLPVREFFTGFQRTALERGELVTAVEVPAQPSRAASFVKLSSLSANDWPCASAAALAVPDASRRQRPVQLRLGLGALAPTPVYLSLALPADTETGEVQEAAARAAEQVIDPLPDVRGGAEFKRRLGLVAVRDAAGSAWEMTREEDADDRRNTRRRWWRGR